MIGFIILKKKIQVQKKTDIETGLGKKRMTRERNAGVNMCGGGKR